MLRHRISNQWENFYFFYWYVTKQVTNERSLVLRHKQVTNERLFSLYYITESKPCDWLCISRGPLKMYNPLILLNSTFLGRFSSYSPRRMTASKGQTKAYGLTKALNCSNYKKVQKSLTNDNLTLYLNPFSPPHLTLSPRISPSPPSVYLPLSHLPTNPLVPLPPPSPTPTMHWKKQHKNKMHFYAHIRKVCEEKWHQPYWIRI